MSTKTKKIKPSLKSLTQDEISNIAGITNFMSDGVEYKCDEEHDCANNGCYDDLCRCGRIVDVQITSINKFNMARSFIRRLQSGKYEVNELDKYCIERIFSNTPFDINSFHLDIRPGYYGDELFAITTNIDFDCVDALYQIFQETSSINKIKIIMKYEYGYLIDLIQESSKATITQIDIDNIVAGNITYYKKVDVLAANIYQYHINSAKFIWCVCVKSGNQYRIIDGYHRYATKMKFTPRCKRATIIVLS